MIPRRCGGCGATAGPFHQTRYRVNGIPMGSSFRFACAGCKTEFELLSTARLIIIMCSFAIMAAAAGVLAYFEIRHASRSPASVWVPAGLCALAAGLAAWRIRGDLGARRRHAALPPEPR